MTLDELLARLESVRDPSVLSRLDRRKLEHLSRGALDPRQIECLRRLAPELVEGREPWIPRVGESFVLTASAAGAEVVRLRVERKGEPYTLETTGLGADAARQVRLVYQVLRQLVAERRRGVPELGSVGHVVTCTQANGDGASLDGASLGVSAAAAFVSVWLGRPPRAGLAATARVDGMGVLRAVAYVDAKWEAVRRERPGIELLVAMEQSFENQGIVRFEALEDALRSFELELDELRPSRSTAAQRERELQQLSHAQSEGYSAERWLDFVGRALALAGDPDCEPDVRTMARGHAMLFALHAGDLLHAGHLGSQISDADLECLGDSGRAWVYVARASTAIDSGDFERAIGLAERAVEAAQALREPRDRREVVGRAFGTLGRALMHASRDEEAHAFLEKGAEHHRLHLPDELPRSLCYLATNLRRLGRLEEAARILMQAVDEIAGRDDAAAATTGLFLRYEQARLRFERGDYEGCLRDIALIQRRQPSATQYPRLGALRYDVACRAILGESARAETLRKEALALVANAQRGPERRLAEVVAEVDLLDPCGSRSNWDPLDLVY